MASENSYARIMHPRSAALLVSLVLAACGGGGGGGGGGATPQSLDLSARRYLPLQVGHRWIYEDSSLTRPVTVRITGTRTVGGVSGFVQQSDDPEDEETVLVEDAQGVREFPGQDASPLTEAVGPVQLLRYPLRVGDTHVVADKQLNALMDFDLDGRADDVNLRADAVVVGLEAQDTPAGRVADCLHLRTTAVVRVRLAATGQTVTVTTTGDDWFAPGVGRVRSEATTRGDGLTPSTVTQRVVAYALGSLRSESVAPTASAPALPAGTVLGRNAVIRIDFSEDMDVATLAAALQVTDNTGRVVAGSMSVADRGLQFSPAAGWTSGDYVARLAASAQDRVGNALAMAQSWNFGVDATAPALVSSSPVEGTIDVALASSIVLRISEPVDPASVNAGPSGFVQAPSVTADATVGAATRARLAVGDLNGDGRPDIVVSSDNLPGFAAAALLLQAGDGGFGAPQWLFTGGNESAGNLAIGDIDGDGRADLVGAPAQGLTVFAQRSDGQLAAPRRLSTDPFPSAPVLADVNGDGRLDILAAAGAFDFELRLQQADGTLAAPAVYPDSFRGAGLDPATVAVTDVNGDGRADVLIGGHLFLQREVPLMAQSVQPPAAAAGRGRVQVLRQAVQQAVWAQRLR